MRRLWAGVVRPRRWAIPLPTSVLARRPADGALFWAYQFTPHESWDYDSNAEMILADLSIEGTKHRVLVHFDENGFGYTIDRAAGEVLVAEPFVPVDLARGIDLAAGMRQLARWNSASNSG